MKKKNIAMMMAGVTVASTVAPVFAGQAVQDNTIYVNVKDGQNTANEIEKLLAVKFEDVKASNEVDERVYTVVVNGTEMDNSLLVREEINNNDSVLITITDKGHRIVDSKVVDYKIEKYKNAQEIVADVKGAKDKKLSAEITSLDTVDVKETIDGKTVVLATVKVGDDKLNFANRVTDVNDKFVKFEKQFTDIAAKTYKVKITKNEVVNSDVLFDGVRLTEEGAELLAALTTANTTIAVKADSATDVDDPEFTLETSFDIVKKNTANNTEEVVATIESDNPQILKELKAILRGEQANVNLLAGESRFTTAIEVSKQLVAEGKTANSVILVGEDAIVDGLAAAPLAKKLGAPILLAKKDSLTAETEKEMLRVLGDSSNKTVYLVGGESVISKELEAKIAKLGVKEVKRLAGHDRFETSLEIAKEVTTKSKLNTDNTTFVVGGNGEADAMSISAYAAQIEAPIVVVDKNTVSEDAVKFLSNTNIEIIGGTGVVSEDVKDQLKEIDKDKKVVRLAGKTRQETNAEVINAHYDNNPTTAFIAKDGYVGGNGKLIDALTAAPLAGKYSAPIVLTSEELTKEQANVVDVRLSSVNKIVQIGKGIADSAIKTMVEMIKANN